MAKVISISNQKGGVGKSQITLMTAAALSSPPFDLKVCVVDLDNQQSIVRTRTYDLQAYGIDSVAAPFDVLNYDIADLQNDITRLDQNFDVVLIDTAGKLDNKLPIESQEITKVLVYADFVFLPFVAGNHNLEATLDYFKFIKAVQLQRAIQPRPLQVLGFVNMHRARSRANVFLNEDLDSLQAKEGLRMMKMALNDYALFREADTITSIYDPLSNESAKLNFLAWINEFIMLIQGKAQ
jgi:cellulose biosynthesis protein BcsQ